MPLKIAVDERARCVSCHLLKHHVQWSSAYICIIIDLALLLVMVKFFGKLP